MKNILIIIFLALASILRGQTDSLEKAVLYKAMTNKQIEQEEFKRKWVSWKQAVTDFKGYPDLPLDRTGHVHYSFLNEFGDFTREVLFTRALEWLSINYGLIPSYLYSSPGDGKIIFRNGVTLKDGTTCNYTSVITAGNGKILTEFISIGYQKSYEGNYSDDMTESFTIDQVYPVILKKPSEWKKDLVLLKATNEFFDTEVANLVSYILSYDKTYNF